ncbi:NADP-binding protein [Dacryopinax primogenitus]|uniref:NADP-binding protein n=1 Tax=Dacryopinax primogenitus (strain DJM 731) TaxID=1858805 RepID=M5G8Q2_DACPD|nr:NADP-binding protein [Dacryopinax primogenitus]EJU05124.1 NADP-binding protein [Dacryopinax primogenitus]
MTAPYTLTAFDEDLPVLFHHDLYAGIDPNKFRGSAFGKVVFITGASRGIGEATAIAFAEAGASIFLVSRKLSTLESVKASILAVSPATAVGIQPADVTVPEEVHTAVLSCIAQFGKMDIAIANAGASEKLGTSLIDIDPNEWWRIWEVNVRGTFNTAHYTVPYLKERAGCLLITTSRAAQKRRAGTSAYGTSKHAINRLTEFIALENEKDGVKVFAVHPGSVKTDMSINDGGPMIADLLIDDVKLPAWTMVRLASGSDNYLSGRYVSAYWDLDQVAALYKARILKDDALKNRLSLPI